MSALFLAIGIAAVGAAVAAILASARRGTVSDFRRGPTEPDSVKRIQQSARDYISSGAVPRWD